jgi:DNA-binding LacI/PurR family transcriptional regulator
MKKNGKSEIILQAIVNAIHAGEYRPGERMPCGIELAEKYGVSHLTMRRILKQLKVHGFITMRPKKGIYVQGRTQPKHVVVVVEYADDPHAIFPRRLQRALVDAGCIINVFDLRLLVSHPEVFLNSFAVPQDFLIFSDAAFIPQELLDRVPPETRKIIYYRCGRKTAANDFQVLADHFDAGYKGMQSLLASGRKKLMLLETESAFLKNHPSYFYMKGANQMAAEAGVSLPKLLHPEELNSGKIAWALEPSRFDGILAAQDFYLIPIIEAARIRGVRIPNDLALVGHCNTPWAEQYSLSSTDIQANKIVSKIIDIILEGRKQVTKIPAKMIYRQSCPAVNNL